MALSLDYSVSQDALLAACIALVYALITTLLVAENSHPSRTIFEVCGLIALICASKPVYILLLGFVLAVGFTRNGPASRSVRRLAVQRRRAALIGTVLAGMFALAWTATQPTGLPAPGARSHRTLQTRLLEHHPVTVAHDILTSMHIQAIPIWKSTLGVLGWLDTVFPLWVYVLLSVAIVLLLVASAPVDDDVLLHRPFRGVALVFVCSAVPLVYLVVFLGFNQGFGEIAGVQGRYLTPLLPYLVLVVAGGGRWVRWIRRSAVHQVSTFVGYGVILFSTTAAVGLTLLGRYFG